jgi:quinol monooxygenase YgiN
MPEGTQIVVVASMKVRPELKDEVRAALIRQVERVHAEEPGALRFAAHESTDRLTLIEKWDSAESLAAHVAGEAIAEYRAVLEPALLEPAEIQILTPIPAGDPGKGTI